VTWVVVGWRRAVLIDAKARRLPIGIERRSVLRTTAAFLVRNVTTVSHAQW
jgi:hypothetical protein